jgi:hypothetical protein
LNVFETNDVEAKAIPVEGPARNIPENANGGDLWMNAGGGVKNKRGMRAPRKLTSP